MKKAKIMLASIAVFALVGGAFAFQANKLSKILYFPSATTTVNGVTVPVGNCTIPVQPATTTLSTDADALTGFYFTTSGACVSGIYEIVHD